MHTENGEFYTYIIDNPFLVNGVIYVGWEQTTDNLLNIGFDKNISANDYMFYNIGNGWNNSTYPGAWLIRPVVSENPLSLSLDVLYSDFKIYPNPVKSVLFIETVVAENVISIYNLQGVLVIQQITSNVITKVNVSDLSSSVYFVEVANENGKQYQKIIVK